MWKVLTACLLLCLSVATFSEEASESLNARIVGGSDADILDYPYQVSIELMHTHVCGGAIIARTWILSAAQCAYGFPAKIFRIRLGTSNLDSGGQLYNVSTVIHHQNYSTGTHDFDIALFQLEEPIELSESAKIISLADNQDAIVDGSLAKLAGWGYQNENGSDSTTLQAVEVPVISQPVCKDLYSTFEVTGRMFCAGLSDGGKDACSGDAGGPLVSDSKVIGIVSWGNGCARPENPRVYTNVGVFRDWITEQTGI